MSPPLSHHTSFYSSLFFIEEMHKAAVKLQTLQWILCVHMDRSEIPLWAHLSAWGLLYAALFLLHYES